MLHATVGTDSLWVARVIRREQIAHEVTLLELAPADGQALPAFTAGAHIALHTAAGVRQYSLCNRPDERDFLRIAVRLESQGRGGSRHVVESMHEGQTVQVDGPFNHFPLQADDAFPLLIAGGIGITPMLGMALECQAQGRPFELHYAGRASQHMAFLSGVREQFKDAARVYASDLNGGARMPLQQLIAEPGAERHLYVCGPASLIDEVCAIARSRGWPDHRIHFERFQGEQPVPLDGDQPFEVQIQSTGRCIEVAADETVAQALERSGIYLNQSCGSGVCGTCRTGVLAGQVDHRDYFFSPDQQALNTEFTPCCSRARSARLVLDL
ncbi:PDR/VanB family oxidoreductase [Xanthomonas sp. WHRI 1810A]|uniref:PDR/VanB family oxidoreductase n=1 Tax=Xanthomonas sp. WHRI 1810A TaxID=3161565 RepID=UPI0032E880CD